MKNYNFLFSTDENNLLLKIEKSNYDEILYWRVPNVIYPITVIVISIIAYYIFKPGQPTFKDIINLLLNGSIPMVALSRMSSIGSHLFKFDASKEKTNNTKSTNLRVKIDEYSRILFLFIAIYYMYQVINGPFELTWFLCIQFVVSFFLIKCSMHLSKAAFLLQEKLIERTVADDIKESAKNNRDHLDEKYSDI